MSEPLNLPAYFPPTDLDAWQAAVALALKGADFEQALTFQSLEGLRYAPLYTLADLPAPLPTAPGSGDRRRGFVPEPGWQMLQAYALTQSEELNQTLKQDHEQGLEAALLEALPTDLPLALADLETLPVHLLLPQPELALSQVQSCLQGAGFVGSLGADPVSAWVQGQNTDLETGFNGLAQVWHALAETAHVPCLWISSRPWHEAGAHAVQELAYLAAGLVDSLQALSQRGLTPQQVLPQTRFELSASVQFFMELAKFRAARILLQRLAEIYGCADMPLQLQARTSRFWLTLADPYNNFLRQTLGTLAAVLGGAQSVSTESFNQASGQPDAFARRLARNVHLLLKHEVHLDHLLDPAGGSYFIENLTQQLATAAWKQFQSIEAAGGLTQAVKTGEVQAAVAAVAEQRRQELQAQKQILVGVNRYVNTESNPQDLHLAAPWPAPITADTGIRLLKPFRLAEALESETP